MKLLYLLPVLLLSVTVYAQVKTVQVITNPGTVAYYEKERGAGGSYTDDENETHATVKLALQGTCQSKPTVQASAYFFNDFPRFGDTAFKAQWINPGSVEFGNLSITEPDSRSYFKQLDSLPPQLEALFGGDVTISIAGNDNFGYKPQTTAFKLPPLLNLTFSKQLSSNLSRTDSFTLQWNADNRSTDLVLRISNMWRADSLGHADPSTSLVPQAIHYILLKDDGEFTLTADNLKDIPANHFVLFELIRRTRKIVSNNGHPVKLLFEEIAACDMFILRD